MRNYVIFIAGFILGLTTALLILFSDDADASDWKLIQMNESKVTYLSFFPGGHDPLITDNQVPGTHSLGKELDLTVNTTIAKYLYWNSFIHSMTDEGQFRSVNLQMDFGVRLSTYLDLYYHHSSAHVLDGEYGHHFPVEDGVGLNLYLYRDNKPIEGILP